MKRILYIGIYNNGSTSKMRADKVNVILHDWEMEIINTDVPQQKMCRIWQSIGFRYKKGPLINKVNRYVLDNIKYDYYDLIWVDKAIYLTKNTTLTLRKLTDKLVHYTPDPAFKFHRSGLFYESMPLYDYMVTTKSYELQDFIRVMGNQDKVLYATQGFDNALHRPVVAWENKKGVAFIGHYEAERELPIKMLLQNKIDVTLAGIKWDKFAKLHQSPYLHYLGGGVYGEEYVRAINQCWFAWGSVSKWIPERHTTRTFEIPACKTALLTERNDEIEGFFANDEVIYYEGTDDLVDKVKYYSTHLEELKLLIEKGYDKVQSGRFDYESIIKNLLIDMKIV